MSAFQARLTVDLDALAANFALLRRLAGAAEVAPVVKAGAYGLGSAPVARRLQAEGAKSFFVARLTEGETLRGALGEGASIYVLDGCPAGSAERLIASRLTPVLNSLEQVEAWSAARGGPCVLHVDTGLNRLGLRKDEAEGLAKAQSAQGGLEIAVIMSHLSCGASHDHPMNHRQAESFAAIRALFPDARASLANSGGLFHGGGFLHDLVRPGITLYGGGPFDHADPRIAPVVTLEAPVLQVRDVPAGESVGYDGGFTAPRAMKVAILAAGHADGLLRAQSPAGWAVFDGLRRSFVGRVSMDLIAVDVSEDQAPRAGDMVQMIGPDVLIDEVAAASGTIAYEILTRLGDRFETIYKGAVQ
ncbi:alanine racemase [Phenylobacterium montanum]|uniref:Alanine racemase n=1 Tax=Phenylobacterium montanum TaxID=2823693 RepID=A0A975G0R1_9CAUL|nr:alanine racemase [Caulobacter sp. S6]QUD88985.1 alanine racemase [Caulobacter sp. S6]